MLTFYNGNGQDPPQMSDKEYIIYLFDNFHDTSKFLHELKVDLILSDILLSSNVESKVVQPEDYYQLGYSDKNLVFITGSYKHYEVIKNRNISCLLKPIDAAELHELVKNKIISL